MWRAARWVLAAVPLLVSMGCMCPTGQISCGGQCTDLSSDPLACGACGRACTGGQLCQDGDCVCAPGWGQCSFGGGCVELATDHAHCGSCGRACPPDAACVAGTCTCPDGLSVCGSECRDLGSLTNCGACDRWCAEGATCAGGSCECPGVMPAVCADFCVDLADDEDHCGGCDQPCALGASCVEGTCACNRPGETICGDRCYALESDRLHCGRCDRVCPTGASCVSGGCVCDGAATLCGSTCVDTTTSRAHCGGCTTICASGQVCGASRCRPTYASGATASSDTGSIPDVRFAVVAVDDRGDVVWARSSYRSTIHVSSRGADGTVRWTSTISASTEDLGGTCVEPGAHRVGVVFWGSRGVEIHVLDDTGARVWSRTLSSATGRMRAGNCVFSAAGELVVGGTYGGSVDFGGDTRAGDTYGDAFLATYASADGALVRVSTYGGGTTEEPLQVAIAPDGDRVITGETGGLSATVGSTSVNGAFVARLSPTDAVRWVYALGLRHDYLRPIGRPAVDSRGNVFVPGLLQGSSSDVTRTVLGLSYTITRDNDAVVLLALAPDGSGTWIAGVDSDYVGIPAAAAAVDDTPVLAVGRSAPGVSGFTPQVFAYRTDGSVMWTRTFATTSTADVADVAAASSVLAITGSASASIDLGGGPLAASYDDVWLAIYEP
ncbi:MAG: hypothetical protein U0353_01090 [Sandaracinus sp.]